MPNIEPSAVPRAIEAAEGVPLINRVGHAFIKHRMREEGAAWRRMFFSAVEAGAPDGAGRLRGAVAALRAWFEGERFYGCAFMNAAAEHVKGSGGGEPWLRELTAEHHAAVLAFLRDLAGAAGRAEPDMLARQVLLVIDGAIAALMVSGDPRVLDVSERNLRAVLADAA